MNVPLSGRRVLNTGIKLAPDIPREYRDERYDASSCENGTPYRSDYWRSASGGNFSYGSCGSWNGQIQLLPGATAIPTVGEQLSLQLRYRLRLDCPAGRGTLPPLQSVFR